MNLALDLAEKGRGYTSPNPMVGAVVVKAGRIVGRGYHERAGGPHAEVHAIDEAGPDAHDADIYVTLEPCNHTGRTPPCTEKIIQAGIRRVIMAMEDPNPHVKGGGMAYLHSRGITVESGVCEDRARRQNEAFIKHIRTGLPFVILKCAATLDGRLATRTGDSRWITNERSRAFVHEIRHQADSILVGIGTVIQDNPSLTTRLKDRQGKDPRRIILDTRLSIPENARILNMDSAVETLIMTGPGISEEKAGKIERGNSRVIRMDLEEGRIQMKSLMEYLGSQGIMSVLIEGGGRVIASALQANIVDKIYFFYAPKILGGNDGVPICRGPGPALMKDSIRVKDIRVHHFDDDIMIEGYIKSLSMSL